MHSIVKFIFSRAASFILLAFLIAALASATLIENSYDTFIAARYIYKSTWFNTLLFIISINLTAQIFIHKLYLLKKTGSFILHISILIILIGSAITRVTGEEGTMYLLENKSSNEYYPEQEFLILQLSSDPGCSEIKIPIFKSIYAQKPFEEISLLHNSDRIEIIPIEYLPDVVQSIDKSSSNGEDFIELNIAIGPTTRKAFIKQGHTEYVGELKIGYESVNIPCDINIRKLNNELIFSSNYKGEYKESNSSKLQHLNEGIPITINSGNIFFVEGEVFEFENHHPNAVLNISRKQWHSDYKEYAIRFQVKVNDVIYDKTILSNERSIARYNNYQFGRLNCHIALGKIPHKTPFNVFLKDITIDKFGGSMLPSDYMATLTISDKSENQSRTCHLEKNKPLDYAGYRFFLATHKADEQGVILDVNKDYWGTRITYAGYALLCIGFILIFLSRHSRLRTNMRKVFSYSCFLAVLSLTCNTATGRTPSSNFRPISTEHLDQFGKLVCENHSGRFEPVYTMSSNVIHKILKHKQFKDEDGTTYNEVQLLAEMMTFPENWKSKLIIYINNQQIENLIGTKGKYASYNHFINEQGQYKLWQQTQQALNKPEENRTQFDKSVLKINERVYLCDLIFTAQILKVLPSSGKLINAKAPESKTKLKGKWLFINEELNLQPFSYYSLFQQYLIELQNAKTSGNYTKADKIISYIALIQKEHEVSSYFPDKHRITAEIIYIKADPFGRLRYLYVCLVSIGLFIYLLRRFFIADSTAASQAASITSYVISLLLFILFTLAMGTRWYITQHAPWSNGYEALLLSAWSCAFVGLIFSRHKQIVGIGSSLLTALFLILAQHVNYDPALTNLKPILQSPWLIYHVSTLTISYGFFAMAFFIGLIQMIQMVNSRDALHKDLFRKYTQMNEMCMSFGLFLATTGTVLGAVWANESWGRYWGWDVKETWSLIIILSYTLVLHLRMVPGLASGIVVSLGSVYSFATVLMTFFGLNYFFDKGRHTYAKEDAPELTFWIYIIAFLIVTLTITALRNTKKA